MKILYNDEDYMQDCITMVLGGIYGISERAMQCLAEFQGYGDDFFQCTYAEQDNDLCPKEGKVAYLCWKMDGSDEIDTAAIFGPEFFYQHLEAACKETVQRYPQKGKVLFQALAKIRHDLNLD